MKSSSGLLLSTSVNARMYLFTGVTKESWTHSAWKSLRRFWKPFIFLQGRHGWPICFICISWKHALDMDNLCTAQVLSLADFLSEFTDHSSKGVCVTRTVRELHLTASKWKDETELRIYCLLIDAILFVAAVKRVASLINMRRCNKVKTFLSPSTLKPRECTIHPENIYKQGSSCKDISLVDTNLRFLCSLL